MIRLITVLAPSAILAVWGSTYVWSCVQTLSAPGKPVEFKYKSKSGVLRLWAASYVIDWNRGTARVERPRIYDPSGVVIASAAHVDVSGISLPSPKNIVVRVRDISGKLTRLESGQFDVSGYLPEQKGPPSKLPFAVTINRADVDLTDLTGSTPYRQPVIARDIDVRGIGERWIASAAVELPGAGSLRAEVQNLPDEGVLIQGRTAGLELAPILDHLKTSPDGKRLSFLANFKASSLEAIGPVSVFVPKGKPLRLAARLKAVGKSVRYLDYAADQAYFDGVVNGEGAQGELDARYNAMKAKFHGALDWSPDVVLGGQLLVDAPSPASLPGWLHKLVPAKVAFNDAHLDGWLDFRKGSGFRLDGSVTARQAAAYDQRFDQPKLAVSIDPLQARIGIQGGTWAGTPVTGAILVGIKNPTLTGAVTAPSVDLAVVARQLHARGLSGKAQVSVLVGGARANPTAILEASGQGAYRVQGKLLTGRFQAAGNYANDRILVNRLRVGTDAGSARAIGVVNVKKKTLSLKVEANNVRLEKLREDITGSLNASGTVTGAFSDPKFSGHALALGVQASNEQIPFASAQVVADKTRLTANDIHVVKGSGEATGEASVVWKTGALSGSASASNVLLNEYLGDEALGSVTIPKLTLGGTLKEPRAAGTAFGDHLVLGGIAVDRVDIVSSLKGNVANLDSLTAKVGEGTVSASGKYDYSQKQGTFHVKADDLALSRITPPGKGAANVTGNLNGEALATVSASGTWRGKASGNLRDVNVNDTDFGGGTWGVAYDGDDLTGNASIGKLDRFLLFENVDYDTKNDNIKAQVSVLNGSLQDLYTSSRPFFPDISYDLRQKLDSANGDLDATVAFFGPIRNPNVDVKLLEARNLMLQGESLGSLQAAFTKVGTVWTVAAAKWSGPQGTLLLNPSTIDTGGDLSVDGQLTNFDLKYVALVDQSWARLRGDATVWFTAKGRSDSPQIHAALETSQNSTFTIANTGESFNVNLHSIDVSQAVYAADGSYKGGIAVAGEFSYRGLSGKVVAHVPLNFPLEIPDGPEITASLELPDVEVKDLGRYVSILDTDRSNGKLQGTISIVGPKANLALRGSITGRSDELAFDGSETTLKATVLDVKLQDDKILLTFGTNGSAGGTLGANLTASLPDLRSTLDQLAKGDPDKLTHAPVEGSIVASHLAIRQDSKNKEFGTYHATVNSKIDVSGPAVTPLLKGQVGISDTNILLPSIFEGAGPSAEMLFNPHFEIPIRLDEVARFRTSTADVSLTGGGTLTGSLAQPNFNGTLVVQSGRINLPTARVTLEEGGTLRPSYSVSSAGDTNARVDVYLEGNTAVTAMRNGDTVQRYDVRLFITGDLLSEEGINLNATSDPADLTKDEILALLGQTDVFKSLGSASGLTQSETEARIRNALVSIAVPQLTQSFTTQLASNLGLEYLNIDYNALEGASLDFAKVLGKGLILQGRRQISPTVGTRKVDYDLRLTYRLPTRNVALSRLVFSVGLDQDHPYKLGIQYGFRF
ncbi:MAG TPA: translocation/assembly module TamB domain-containing protein [Fimbriimonadaceae bacterium]|nr:translocation/assembly module TamB domain-containing protein [Fimbriimonadaceae bacterium]